jgi:hypothetical protein
VTPLDAALALATRGPGVFPYIPRGPRRKQPLTLNGFHDASSDPAVITGWWRCWPGALIGAAAGAASGFVILDVDVKYPDRHGRGGYVIVPSPGSGYEWDAHWNLDTVPLATVPPTLLPREPGPRTKTARPVKPATGLSAYAEAALDRACRRIITAPSGQQEATLNAECFTIGTLAGAGGIPSDFARRALMWAARQIPDYDHRRPWRTRGIENKVNRAFDQGIQHPREAHRA